MKKFILKNLILTGMVSLTMLACQPDEIPGIGEPLSRMEGITGEWEATSVVQVDEIAKSKGDANFELDVTDLYNLGDYAIAFANDGTFTITANGAPNFVDESGTWSFDDPDFPTKVLLFADGSVDPTSEFALARVPAAGFDLKIEFQRIAGETHYLSYVYTFSKLNN